MADPKYENLPGIVSGLPKTKKMTIYSFKSVIFT